MSSNVSKAQELKALRTQLAKAQGELLAAKSEAGTAQRKVATLGKTIDSIAARIEALEKEPIVVGDVHVSEHALLRYLERVRGIDLTEVRAEMLGKDTKRLIQFAAGNSSRVKRPGFTLIVENNTVVTVYGED